MVTLVIICNIVPYLILHGLSCLVMSPASRQKKTEPTTAPIFGRGSDLYPSSSSFGPSRICFRTRRKEGTPLTCRWGYFPTMHIPFILLPTTVIIPIRFWCLCSALFQLLGQQQQTTFYYKFSLWSHTHPILVSDAWKWSGCHSVACYKIR